MTPEQRALVQDSFERVEPLGDTVAALFYGRLFELDPSLRPMFRGDMQAQERKLLQALALAVRSLDHLETLVPILEALGRRHAAYGVKDEHYATVGAALLWTLRQGLGDGFTAEVEEAWATVYQLVATTMKEAPLTEEAA